VSTWAVLYWLLIVAVMLMACVFIPPGWPEAARVRRLPRAAWEGARDTVAITVIAVMALWQGPSPAHPARRAAAKKAGEGKGRLVKWPPPRVLLTAQEHLKFHAATVSFYNDDEADSHWERLADRVIPDSIPKPRTSNEGEQQ
jgi:hypothetical protein